MGRYLQLVCILWLVCPAPGQTTQLDNGVLGTPQVRCSEGAITFSVRSQNIFRGNIYIKNQFGVPNCRQEYSTNDFNGASFSVTIGDCGMRRIRQLQPQGMNYMIVFVVNFHKQFVTKVDRAYNVRCFYAQTEKTVTSQLDISMLQTETLEQATMVMPNCEYSVRSGSLNGARVRYARVGDQLVHRWECDNPNFGMLVKNCFVNDGAGSSVRVLDARGCPVFTPVIQGPLQYDNSLNLAYTDIWAYKFPDRAQLFFQCQIQICNKRDNECVGVTPPNCPLVLKQDFNPNSNLNTNTDPNQVRGTFGGTGFNVDNAAGNLQPIRPIVTRPGAGPELAGVFPTIASNVGGYNYNNNQNINQGQLSFGTDSQSQSSYNYNSPGFGVQSQVDQQNNYAYGGGQNTGASQTVIGFQNQGAQGLQPARPYSLRFQDETEKSGERAQRSPPDSVYRRNQEAWDRPTKDPLSVLLRPEQEADYNNQMEDEQVEDGTETLDVVAEALFIVDNDAVIDDSDDFTDLPSLSNGSRQRSAKAGHAFCLDYSGVSLLLSAFIIMLISLGIAAGYIAHLWHKEDTGKADRSNVRLNALAKIAQFTGLGKPELGTDQGSLASVTTSTDDTASAKSSERGYATTSSSASSAITKGTRPKLNNTKLAVP